MQETGDLRTKSKGRDGQQFPTEFSRFVEGTRGGCVTFFLSSELIVIMVQAFPFLYFVHLSVHSEKRTSMLSVVKNKLQEGLIGVENSLKSKVPSKLKSQKENGRDIPGTEPCLCRGNLG